MKWGEGDREDAKNETQKAPEMNIKGEFQLPG